MPLEGLERVVLGRDSHGKKGFVFTFLFNESCVDVGEVGMRHLRDEHVFLRP